MPSSSKIFDELLTNQNFILEAIQNLNERLGTIEEKFNDAKLSKLNEVIEAQALIDEIQVKTTDDISVMKKVKEENDNAIKLLESKIDILDKVIKQAGAELCQAQQKLGLAKLANLARLLFP